VAHTYALDWGWRVVETVLRHAGGPWAWGMFAPVAQASPGASASVVSWNAGAAAG